MSKRFNIGDKVYVSAFERTAITVPCPDCFGSRRVRVIRGDETEVSIECGGCNPGGFEPSRGYIINYQWTASANLRIITGVAEKLDDKGETKYEYHFAGGYCDYDGKTFATKEEALAKANELRQAHEDEENRRLMAKTNNHKSWAFNYSYHVKGAAQARKDWAYHEAKAVVCKKKAWNRENKEETKDDT